MLSGSWDILLTREIAYAGQHGMPFASRRVLRPCGAVLTSTFIDSRKRSPGVSIVELLLHRPKLAEGASNLNVLNYDSAAHLMRPNTGAQDALLAAERM
jgi:hypothetical protein